ncbi:MAG: hypothetical protein NZM25_01400 [Leptospiraceae bacterium]|nr:hypothetical protein [Leptospiraceae bacterium]MDW8306381.1 hypothetical protein [Leptospiraceae bacterium]
MEKTQKEPFNLARKLFHLFGLVIPLVYFFNLLDYLFPAIFKDNTRSWGFFLLLGLVAILLLVEYLRFRYPFWQNLFLKVASPLLKDKELGKMHGSIPYILGMCLVVGFMPREVAMITGLYLAFGDPTAAYFGGKYGTMRFYNGKSLQGLVAGIVGGFISSVIFMAWATVYTNSASHLALWNYDGPIWTSWGILFIGSVVAMALEFISHEGFLDDNLLIPIGAGATITVLLALFKGEPLFSYFYPLHLLFQ